jgi:hypothetical protein
MSVSERAIQIAPIYGRGRSISEICRLTGLSWRTIRKAVRVLRLIHIPDCECGRKAGHKGFCPSRARRRNEETGSLIARRAADVRL